MTRLFSTVVTQFLGSKLGLAPQEEIKKIETKRDRKREKYQTGGFPKEGIKKDLELICISDKLIL